MARELDISRLLGALDRHGVDYVVIGGMAAVIHGSPFPTEDLDITPAADESNLGHLSAALTELDAKVRTEGAPDGRPLTHDARSLASARTWHLTTSYGDLDISLVPSGTSGFADLNRSAEPRRPRVRRRGARLRG